MMHAIGKHVEVVKPEDETMLMKFFGLQGTIIEHNGNNATGNPPEHPLHVVAFDIEGCGYLQKETFWFSELKVIKGPPKKKQKYNETITYPDYLGSITDTSGIDKQSSNTESPAEDSGRDDSGVHEQTGEDTNFERGSIPPGHGEI